MNGNKTHLTQITRKDIAELAAMSKLKTGIGLHLSRKPDGWQLDINLEELVQILSRIGVVIGGTDGMGGI